MPNDEISFGMQECDRVCVNCQKVGYTGRQEVDYTGRIH